MGWILNVVTGWGRMYLYCIDPCEFPVWGLRWRTVVRATVLRTKRPKWDVIYIFRICKEWVSKQQLLLIVHHFYDRLITHEGLQRTLNGKVCCWRRVLSAYWSLRKYIPLIRAHHLLIHNITLFCLKSFNRHNSAHVKTISTSV